jgi:phosphopantetheinyl transferase
MTGTPLQPANDIDAPPPSTTLERLEVWHVDLDAMGSALEDLENAHGFMPPGELQSHDRSLDIVLPAADRLRNRRRARIALRALLFKNAAADAKGLPFTVDGHGKPALDGGNPAFNMSHSQTRCLIAIG